MVQILDDRRAGHDPIAQADRDEILDDRNVVQLMLNIELDADARRFMLKCNPWTARLPQCNEELRTPSPTR